MVGVPFHERLKPSILIFAFGGEHIGRWLVAYEIVGIAESAAVVATLNIFIVGAKSRKEYVAVVTLQIVENHAHLFGLEVQEYRAHQLNDIEATELWQ